MPKNLAKTKVFAGSEIHEKAEVEPKKAKVGPKRAQVGRKMAQDRVKMAKMGEDWREVSGRWLKMRRMSSKMRLKIVTMRFRSDFGGQNEKKKSVQGPSGAVSGSCPTECAALL